MFTRRTNEYTQKVSKLLKFGCPKGVERNGLFSREAYHSQNVRYETSKSLLFEKTNCVSHNSFPVKVMND